MVQQMRGKRMAQGVRRQFGGDADHLRVFLDDHPEHHTRHRRAGFHAAMRHKQIVSRAARRHGRAHLLQVLAQPVGRHFAKRNQPFFGTLAKHPQHVVGLADVQDFERDQFTHPQAAGVHQLDHGAVAHAQGRAQIGREQQSLDLRFGQRGGAAHRLTRGLQFQCRVGADAALTQGPPVIPFEHGEATVGRGGF